MASFDQKLRTLYLMEILLERTDDEHMLNASELCTILDQEYGISTDRMNNLYRDGEFLINSDWMSSRRKAKSRDIRGKMPSPKVIWNAF